MFSSSSRVYPSCSQVESLAKTKLAVSGYPEDLRTSAAPPEAWAMAQFFL